MKWCLCTHRWKEAFDAAQKGELAHTAVPRVHIHATHESALNQVSYSNLNKYAADPEAPNQQNRQDSHVEGGQSKYGVEMNVTEGDQHPNTSGGNHDMK